MKSFWLRCSVHESYGSEGVFRIELCSNMSITGPIIESSIFNSRFGKGK